MTTRNDVEKAIQYMDAHNLIRANRPMNNWYSVHCPFHNNGQERKPSCGCSLEGETRNGNTYYPGTWHCFACGVTYPFSVGVQEILKLKNTTMEEHPELQQYVNTDIQVQKDSLIPDQLMTNIFSTFAAADLRTRVLHKQEFVSEEELAGYRFTVPYMYERKLTDPIIEKYDVGFDPNHIPPGRKKPLPCVTFPVKDLQGNVLFICRRSIEGKYFNLPQGIEKSVYGIYELPPETKEVIICESVFNALTCVAYGHPAVALFGTGTTYEMDQLKKLGIPNYIVCLDNDEAGNRGAAKIKKALSKTSMVWTMHVPEGKDVNDLTYEEFVEVYNARD